MRIETFEVSKKVKEVRFHYDSWFEFIEFADKRKAAVGSWDSSRKQDVDFTGTYTFEEAKKLAEEGWPEGTARVKALAAFLTNKVTQLIEREEIRFDVTGNDFDIALVNQNVPESWYRFETSEITEGTGNKVVRLVLNSAISGAISTETLIARGATACALVESLEYAGFRVEVLLRKRVESSGGVNAYYSIFVPIKAADSQLDSDKLAFALAHPSTNRRMCFAVFESDEEFCKTNACGYGKPTPLSKEDAGDIYISQSMYGEPQWTSPKAATDWILSELRKQGVILSEEVPA